jgi:hypothetical protein
MVRGKGRRPGFKALGEGKTEIKTRMFAPQTTLAWTHSTIGDVTPMEFINNHQGETLVSPDYHTSYCRYPVKPLVT